jgi:hypothetical protein
LAESINTKYLTAGSEFEVAAAPEMKSKLSADIENKQVHLYCLPSVQDQLSLSLLTYSICMYVYAMLI